MSSNTWIELFN